MAKVREYLMSLDDYCNPKILKNEDAVVTVLWRLIVMNPGEVETHPTMGLGFAKYYRGREMTDLCTSLPLDLRKQIETFLPEFQCSSVKCQQSPNDPKTAIISIQISKTLYTFTGDLNNGIVNISNYLGQK